MVCFVGLEKTKMPMVWNFFLLSSGNKVACFYFPLMRSNLLASAVICYLSSPCWVKAGRTLSPEGGLSLEMVMLLRERWWYSICFVHRFHPPPTVPLARRIGKGQRGWTKLLYPTRTVASSKQCLVLEMGKELLCLTLPELTSRAEKRTQDGHSSGPSPCLFHSTCTCCVVFTMPKSKFSVQVRSLTKSPLEIF